MISLGSLPSFMRVAWPSQRKRRFVSMENVVVVPALTKAFFGCVVLPKKAKDPSETAQVKCVEPALLA